MKKYIYMIAMSLAAVPALAQETYENAKIAGEDLNGTARYVGMGGAMDALGADISTIGTNPAGIGLFRKSSASLSFGVVSQEDAASFSSASKTKMSFDQLGFVVTTRTSPTSFVNFAFNYHKSRNFNYILSAADGLNNASQNKLTYAKQKNGLAFPADNQGRPIFNEPYISCNQLDDIYARGINYDEGQNTWYYDPAQGYTLDRSHTGYVGEYDFNISGNINNRVYLGLTIGIHDVHYSHYSEYYEKYASNNNILVADDRDISGTGADIKAGIIFRPLEESPFRIGLSVATPTFYKLTTSNYTTLSDNGGTAWNTESYKFKLYTPWKFGLSVGHTVGNYLALGAGFDYADYGSLDTRYITDSYSDGWDTYEESKSDEVMNRHTEQSLKGVATLKVGAELKPDPALAVRLGYNYVTPMYKDGAFKDGTLDSDGSYYSSATDYTNWDATHRITCGVGYNIGKLNISAAYQYTTQKGKFMPFMNYLDNDTQLEDNVANEVSVSNKRHQVLLTLGYTF